MRKLWMASVAAMIAAGFAFAAGEAEKPAAPATPAEQRPAVKDPDRISDLIARNKAMLHGWEEALAKAESGDYKKALTEVIDKAKEIQPILEQAAAALEAGKQPDAHQLILQSREKQQDLWNGSYIVRVYAEIERVKALQEARKDNADLSAVCQRLIDLLNKRLVLLKQSYDIQKQLTALEAELNKERLALRNPPKAAPTDK